MGKTNLLDAIYYLSFCKSYSHIADSQIIRHDEDFFMLQGYYDNNGNEEEVYCGMKKRQKKQFKRNKKEYGRLSDHIGFIPLVMVSPSDSDLILGGSDERRRFLDLVISQFDKNYLDTLIRYNKALAQRNALLKQEIKDAALYEIWEEQMSVTGEEIFKQRKSFLSTFIPVFQEFYTYISGGNESVGLSYRSHHEHGELFAQLAEVRERDRILGYTTRGSHKDELEMTLNEQLIRRAGSQGQIKTYLIALKLAQFAFLTRKGQTTPILLLDDIFDILDAARVAEIIKLVSGDSFGQIFITDTNRKNLDEILQAMNHDYALFRVEQGEVQPMEDQP